MTTRELAAATDEQRKAKLEARRAARRAQRPASIDPHQAYSLDETGAALDASRAAIYNMLAKGKLRSIRIDGRRRIPGSEIIRVTSGDAAPAA